MAVLFLLVAILGCALARPSSENVTPVAVTLYYESLCSGCKEFIPNQLYPIYTDTRYNFSSLISKLELVPWGFVYDFNETTRECTCQHGDGECMGNQLQGCAIEYVKDQVTLLGYLTCLEQLKIVDYDTYPIDKCQEKLPEGVYSKIINCYNSDEGWNIAMKNEEKTRPVLDPYSSDFVPFVTFNNVKDTALAHEASDHFRAVLCRLTGLKHEACDS